LTSNDLKPSSGDARDRHTLASRVTLELVAEVRRLRGIIRAFEDNG
jgi:hypothetical protein